MLPDNDTSLEAEDALTKTNRPFDLITSSPFSSAATSTSNESEVLEEDNEVYPESETTRRIGKVTTEPSEKVNVTEQQDSDLSTDESAENTTDATLLASSTTMLPDNDTSLEAEDALTKTNRPFDLITSSPFSSAATSISNESEVLEEDNEVYPESETTRRIGKVTTEPSEKVNVTEQEDSDLSTDESAENTTDATLLASSTTMFPNNDTSLEAEDALTKTSRPFDLITSSPFSSAATSTSNESEVLEEDNEVYPESETTRRIGKVTTEPSKKVNVTEQEDSDLSTDESAENTTDATLLASSTTILPNNDTSIEAEDVPLKTTRPFDLSTSSPFSPTATSTTTESEVLEEDNEESPETETTRRIRKETIEPSEKVNVTEQEDSDLSTDEGAENTTDATPLASSTTILPNNDTSIEAEDVPLKTTRPFDLITSSPFSSAATSTSNESEVLEEDNEVYPESETTRRIGKVTTEPSEKVNVTEQQDSDLSTDESAENTTDATLLASSTTMLPDNDTSLEAEDALTKTNRPFDLITSSPFSSAATSISNESEVLEEDNEVYPESETTRRIGKVTTEPSEKVNVTEQEDSDLSTDESAENTTDATLLASSTTMFPNNDTSLEAEDALTKTSRPFDLITSSPFSSAATSTSNESEVLEEDNEVYPESETTRRIGKVTTEPSKKVNVTEQEDSDLSTDESAENTTDATLLASSTTILPNNDTSIEAEDVPLKTTRPFDLSTSSPFSPTATSTTTESEVLEEDNEESPETETTRRIRKETIEPSEKVNVTEQEDSDLSTDEGAENTTDATPLASSTTILPNNDTSIEAEDVPLKTTRPFDLITSSPFSSAATSTSTESEVLEEDNEVYPESETTRRIGKVTTEPSEKVNVTEQGDSDLSTDESAENTTEATLLASSTTILPNNDTSIGAEDALPKTTRPFDLITSSPFSSAATSTSNESEVLEEDNEVYPESETTRRIGKVTTEPSKKVNVTEQEDSDLSTDESAENTTDATLLASSTTMLPDNDTSLEAEDALTKTSRPFDLITSSPFSSAATSTSNESEVLEEDNEVYPESETTRRIGKVTTEPSKKVNVTEQEDSDLSTDESAENTTDATLLASSTTMLPDNDTSLEAEDALTKTNRPFDLITSSPFSSAATSTSNESEVLEEDNEAYPESETTRRIGKVTTEPSEKVNVTEQEDSDLSTDESAENTTDATLLASSTTMLPDNDTSLEAEDALTKTSRPFDLITSSPFSSAATSTSNESEVLEEDNEVYPESETTRRIGKVTTEPSEKVNVTEQEDSDLSTDESAENTTDAILSASSTTMLPDNDTSLEAEDALPKTTRPFDLITSSPFSWAATSTTTEGEILEEDNEESSHYGTRKRSGKVAIEPSEKHNVIQQDDSDLLADESAENTTDVTSLASSTTIFPDNTAYLEAEDNSLTAAIPVDLSIASLFSSAATSSTSVTNEGRASGEDSEEFSHYSIRKRPGTETLELSKLEVGRQQKISTGEIAEKSSSTTLSPYRAALPLIESTTTSSATTAPMNNETSKSEAIMKRSPILTSLPLNLAYEEKSKTNVQQTTTESPWLVDQKSPWLINTLWLRNLSKGYTRKRFKSRRTRRIP
ncbi:hypothetical protein Q1695_009063 [Nippostrongylus brasiliensis]|nr:hypothetical protein Q1695_009063 [Nippostrongylus brasiliensis]